MREVIATGRTVEEATEQGCRDLGKTRDEVSVEILELPVNKLFKKLPAKVRVTVVEEEAPLAAVQPAAKPSQADAPAPQKPAQENAPAQAPAAPQSAAAAKPQQPATAKKAVLPAEPEVAIDLAQNLPAANAVAYLREVFVAMGAADIAIAAFQQGEATLLRVDGAQITDLIETRGETIQALSYLVDRAVNKGVDKRDPTYLRVRLDVAGYRSRRESELVALATRTGEEVASTGRSRTLAPMNPYERLIIHTTISEMEGVTSESIGSDAERRVVVKSTGPNATDGDDYTPPRSNGNGRGRGQSGRNGSGQGRQRQQGQGGRPGGSGKPPRDRSDRPRPDGRDRQAPRSSAPEREYVDKPYDPAAKPQVPDRREAISDGDDLPLYGKIDF